MAVISTQAHSRMLPLVPQYEQYELVFQWRELGEEREMHTRSPKNRKCPLSHIIIIIIIIIIITYLESLILSVSVLTLFSHEPRLWTGLQKNCYKTLSRLFAVPPSVKRCPWECALLDFWEQHHFSYKMTPARTSLDETIRILITLLIYYLTNYRLWVWNEPLTTRATGFGALP